MTLDDLLARFPHESDALYTLATQLCGYCSMGSEPFFPSNWSRGPDRYGAASRACSMCGRDVTLQDTPEPARTAIERQHIRQHLEAVSVEDLAAWVTYQALLKGELPDLEALSAATQAIWGYTTNLTLGTDLTDRWGFWRHHPHEEEAIRVEI